MEWWKCNLLAIDGERSMINSNTWIHTCGPGSLRGIRGIYSPALYEKFKKDLIDIFLIYQNF